MKMNEEDREKLRMIDTRLKLPTHPIDYLWYWHQKIQILKRYGLISTSEKNNRQKSK